MSAVHSQGGLRPAPLNPITSQPALAATAKLAAPGCSELIAAACTPDEAGDAARAAPLESWGNAVLHSVDATGRVDMQPASLRPMSIASEAFAVLARQVQSLGGSSLRELALPLTPAQIAMEVDQIRQWTASQPGVESLELTFAREPEQACTLDLSGLPETVRSVRVQPSQHLTIISRPGLGCLPTRALTKDEAAMCSVQLPGKTPGTWERVPLGVQGSVGFGISESKVSPELAAKAATAEAKIGPAVASDASPVASAQDAAVRAQRIADVLARKEIDGVKLFDALDKGRAAEVAAFMKTLNTLGLSTQQIANIVAAKDAYGVPGFYMALENGRAASVTAFMDGLRGLGLNTQQIADIVAAKGKYGLPGFHVALSNGYAASVTTFMAGLRALGLSTQQIADIVAAKRNGGGLGIGWAAYHGHSKAVTAFMNGLPTLGLTRQQIADIVSARGPFEGNILANARLHDCPQRRAATEQAFMTGLTRLQQHGLITAKQIATIKNDAKNCVIS